MSNVESMASKANNGTMQTPEDALKDALSSIGKEGSFKEGKKLLILSLDETDGDYAISFIQAGMKMSECLTLCDIAKIVFLEQMNYVNRY